MSVAPFAAAIPIPIPGVRFAKVFPGFDELGAAGQRLWLYLWEATRFGTEPARKTDREMAEACGRGLRWVQKALSQLLNFEEDGVPVPLIDRFRQYGPRHVAGRVIQIIVAFARPAEADKPKPAARATGTPTPTAAAAPAGRAGASPAPAVPIPAAAAPPEPPESPEEAARAMAELKAQVERAKAEGRARVEARRAERHREQAAREAARDPATISPDKLRYLEFLESQGRLAPMERELLEAARGQPAGP